jgi:outer membrane protein TolC
VAVSKLVPELVKAKNSIDLIKADLKKLLGFKMQDNISVDERLHYEQIEIKEGEFLKEAYLNQPEMILKSLGIDIDKWSIQMAKAGWRPQVNAFGGYNYQSNDWSDMVNNRHGNWQAGVSVNMPIFDAWSSKAKVDEAKAKYRQAILAKANVSDQIAVDIRQACLDLRQSEAIIESQRENVDEAKEALRISIVSFDNGVGTNLDVLDSQTSLAQVQQNLSQGIYDYLMAEAFLDRTRAKSYIVEVKNEKKE